MSIRMGVSGSGYATVHDTETGQWVYIHRLAAVAEHGFDAVDASTHVHHVAGFPELNARDELQPLPAWEHCDGTLNGRL